MATKQPGTKMMRVGKHLGQQYHRSRKPRESISKEDNNEKKHVEDDKEVEDHYDDKICMLCCEEIDVIAKGQCNHVICFKCSSRMRTLCGETYCAVCRHELKKVVFIEKNLPFAEISLERLPSEERYGILFQNKNVKKKFKDLLMNICPLCEEKNATFDVLKRHVRHKHEKQYCDICVKNLKVFPQEFRVYSRRELVEHRKTGDRDDKSYKGHPICNFCNERYYDNDELLLHLRRNHFWCHFCENDGRQDYYCNYNDLRSHFRDDHFLCEEKECSLEKYTSVFRSDIDLKAHRLAKHSKRLTKMATKQARQVNVEIDYGTRKTYKDRYSNDRSPKSRQEAIAQRMAMNDGIAEENSEAAGLSGTIKESVDHTTLSDPIISNGNEPGNTEMIGKPLNANAQAFVPSEAATGEIVCAPSLSDSTSDTGKNLKAEVVEKQWSRVISGPIGQDYGAEFPSIHNGGTRPKTSPPLQQKSNRQVDRKPKRVPAEHKNFQNDKHETLLDNSKITKAPPGLNTDKSTRTMLPPGMNITSDTLLNSTKIASSAPPGLGEPTNGIVTQGSKFEQNKIGGNVQERNAALVSLIRSLLNDEDFNRFRNESGRFRRSEIDGPTYYTFIRETFGNNLHMIFNELVDLLPERGKQTQLLQLHASFGRPKSSKIKKEPVTQPIASWQNEGAFPSSSVIVSTDTNATLARNGAVQDAPNQAHSDSSNRSQSQAIKKKPHKGTSACSVCGISLSKKELAKHMVIHNELDFPALPTLSVPQKPWRKQASHTPIPNAWAKSA